MTVHLSLPLRNLKKDIYTFKCGYYCQILSCVLYSCWFSKYSGPELYLRTSEDAAGPVHWLSISGLGSCLKWRWRDQVSWGLFHKSVKDVAWDWQANQRSLHCTALGVRDCCGQGRVESKSKALNLLVSPLFHSQLWSRTLGRVRGSDQFEKIADTSSQNEVPPQDGIELPKREGGKLTYSSTSEGASWGGLGTSFRCPLGRCSRHVLLRRGPKEDPEWVGVAGETMTLGWPQAKWDNDVFYILVAHLSIHREGSLICGCPSGFLFFH